MDSDSTDEYNAAEIRAHFARLHMEKLTRFELPRLFPDLGVSVILELTNGRRVSARLVETAQGVRWIKNGTEAPESWGQWSPEVRAWETRV